MDSVWYSGKPLEFIKIVWDKDFIWSCMWALNAYRANHIRNLMVKYDDKVENHLWFICFLDSGFFVVCLENKMQDLIASSVLLLNSKSFELAFITFLRFPLSWQPFSAGSWSAKLFFPFSSSKLYCAHFCISMFHEPEIKLTCDFW